MLFLHEKQKKSKKFKKNQISMKPNHMFIIHLWLPVGTFVAKIIKCLNLYTEIKLVINYMHCSAHFIVLHLKKN